MMIRYSDEQIYGIIKRRNVASVLMLSLVLLVTTLIYLFLHKLILKSINPINNSLVYLSIFVFGLFLIISFALLKYNLKNNYRSTYYIFWLSFYCLFIGAGFGASTNVGTFFFLAVMLIISSLTPIFIKYEFLTFVVINIFTAVALCYLKTFDAGICSFVFMFVFLCSLLSYIRYKNCVLNTRYKTQLTTAIKMSETDRMTGLLNRRGLERSIESLWPHWIREKTSVAFIMLDIDNFKKYNDEFGHVMGDECIKSISKIIRKAIRRKTDFAARVGGEEFIVCLSGIDGKDSILWAKRLKADIEALEIKHAHNNFLPFVTVSMGLVCEKPSTHEDYEIMYEAADKSLYSAKEFGRACIVFNNRCYDQRYMSDYGNIIRKREKFG